MSEQDAMLVGRSKRLVLLVGALLACGLLWAQFARLDEVTSGQAKVVPYSQEQVIQSLEGGILREMHVRPDSLVEVGSVLARLDPIATAASVREIEEQLSAKRATLLRLKAETEEGVLDFSQEFSVDSAVVAQESALFVARREAYERTKNLLDESYALIREEADMLEDLVATGAVSMNTLIKLQREAIDNRLQADELDRDYFLKSQEDIARLQSEIPPLEAELSRRRDQFQRLTHVSPVQGVVKEVSVTTLGGVVPPNGKLMTIVPLGDELLLETRILPENIAFIGIGMPASIKLTAYDSAIYGSIAGEVVSISADSIRDEIDPNVQYYRIYVRARQQDLPQAGGKPLAITPGMLATVDIQTGQKTVLAYLTKPLNRVAEAMRER